jgi:tRNA1Val (adenine37-N6)-methyltransferase
MSNPYFAFKQFTINHDKCAMKVGTDGVLLGAWVNVNGAERILDVGTGSGLIAIMMAQRSEAVIDAVEIDEKACRQAMENVANCPWEERINVYCDSFQHFAASTAFRYDLVVSNPPFFRDSLKSPIKARSHARHDEKLSYESLIFYTSQLLTVDGRLVLIIPANEVDHIKETAWFYSLFPSQRIMVRPVSDKGYSRCLVEFTRNREQKCREGELIIKQGSSNDYTAEYRKMTDAYYL